MDKKQLHQQRLDRYVTAMRCGQPDRVPVRLFAQEFAAKYCGVSNHAVAINKEIAFQVTRKCAEELGVDAAMPNAIVNWYGMSEAIGWNGIVFPGVGWDVNSVTQWSEPHDEETALLKVDEYDAFTEDPTAWLMNTWFGRMSKHIEPLGSPVTYNHNIALISGAMSFLTYMNDFGTYGAEFVKAGIVPANAGTLKAPLDLLGDKLRGYVNLCFDLLERPDKVKAACEAMMPHVLKCALAGADPTGQVPITIWMHRGCTPFVSPKVFREIYWATLRPVIEEIWAHGHQTLFYAEGDWDEHLADFAELPEGSIIYHVDRGDIFKAREVFGNRFCISGGVGNDILARGTTKDVENRCREIFEGVAKDGAYIMDASALIMDDAKTENVRAMIDWTQEHAVYSGSGRAALSIPEVNDKPITRFAVSHRPPGSCVPWDDKKKTLPVITGDEALVRATHELTDGMAYNFIWTNLTW